MNKTSHNILSVKKMVVVATLLPSLALSGAILPMVAQAVPDQVCSTTTLVSGTNTQTAGFTETNPLAAPASLDASAYSNGSFEAATAVQQSGAWFDPAVDSNFSGSGAVWVSTGTSWPDNLGGTEGDASDDQWRLFMDSFSLPANAVVTNATLYYGADNAVDVYLGSNNTPIITTGDVYGAVGTNNNFGTSTSAVFTPDSGLNILRFVVRNWGMDASPNPTGLVYKAVINYCVPGDNGGGGGQNPQIRIVKHIDGQLATSANAQGLSFSMMANWNSTSTGSASGTFTLAPAGTVNDPTPYRELITNVPMGGSYMTQEVLTESSVGADCTSGKPFRLDGYTTGTTLAQAQSGTPTSTTPHLMDIDGNMWIVVWNSSCPSPNPGPGTLGVTSIEQVKASGTADGTFASGWVYMFNITVPTGEPNLAMKFADWTKTGGGGSIPVANNMRISSAQANSTSSITLTAADTYSSPDLVMTGDLNPSMPGMQVQVKVEVAIPSGTPSGSYSTTYGVRTLP